MEPSNAIELVRQHIADQIVLREVDGVAVAFYSGQETAEDCRFFLVQMPLQVPMTGGSTYAALSKKTGRISLFRS